MKGETKPRILTIDEFRKIAKPVRRSVAIFYSQQQLDRAVKGVKPSMHAPAGGPGLEIIPIPGGPGYIAFPVCWPDEVPVIGPNGRIRCIPTAFGDTPLPPEVTVRPDRVCGLEVTVTGGLRCSGRCAGGGACVRIFSMEGGRFGFRCRCAVPLPARRTAIALEAG